MDLSAMFISTSATTDEQYSITSLSVALLKKSGTGNVKELPIMVLAMLIYASKNYH